MPGRKTRAKTTPLKIERGSGNVFADIGMSDADERMRKAELAVEIANVIESKRLTQVEAARLLGVDQPKVSSLVRGRLEGFSIGRLLLFLNRLGRDVTIEVREAPRRRAGETRVRVA